MHAINHQDCICIFKNGTLSSTSSPKSYKVGLSYSRLVKGGLFWKKNGFSSKSLLWSKCLERTAFFLPNLWYYHFYELKNHDPKCINHHDNNLHPLKHSITCINQTYISWIGFYENIIWFNDSIIFLLRPLMAQHISLVAHFGFDGAHFRLLEGHHWPLEGHIEPHNA